MTYARETLMEEVAYVAYYLHWSMESILDIEHPLRRQVIADIDRIDQQARERRWG
jgi:hypothetical protein